jgi:hypothetical protein
MVDEVGAMMEVGWCGCLAGYGSKGEGLERERIRFESVRVRVNGLELW